MTVNFIGHTNVNVKYLSFSYLVTCYTIELIAEDMKPTKSIFAIDFQQATRSIYKSITLISWHRCVESINVWHILYVLLLLMYSLYAKMFSFFLFCLFFVEVLVQCGNWFSLIYFNWLHEIVMKMHLTVDYAYE